MRFPHSVPVWPTAMAAVAMIMIATGSCDSGSAEPAGAGDPKTYMYELVPAFPNLSFANPLDLRSPNDGTNRIFVVEQAGRIMVFPNDPNVTAGQLVTFLDIRNRVVSGGEEGLLGLAFDPGYAGNGRFYVYYNDSVQPRRTQVVRYLRSADDPDVAVDDPDVIITIDQPYANHNGGSILFGPDDGYLYVGLGDGGLANDPAGNGQNRMTLLGSIIRIDVNATQGQLNYAVPGDNPFAGNQNGWRDEIWAWGMRNPWRMSLDGATGYLWCADVGQNTWEEVDIIAKGANYGWVTMEGPQCFQPPNCDQTGLELPIWEYDHPNGAGRSITGGYVYRGGKLAGLAGAYIYADFRSGEVLALRYDGNTVENELLMDTNLFIASFGIDEAGEIYVCAFDGTIYRFEATEEGN